jgi:hypothetical protein
MSGLNVKAAYVKYASQFVSTDVSRLNLAGVHVRPHVSGKGAIIEATNGHIAGLFYDDTGVCPKPILLNPTKELLKACVKPIKHAVTELRLTYTDKKLFVSHGTDVAVGVALATQTECCTLDYKYVDIDNAIPKTDLKHGALSQGYNPAYFERFMFDLKKEQYLVFLTGDPLYTNVVFNTRYPEFVGLFMPAVFKNEDQYAALPAWLTDKGVVRFAGKPVDDCSDLTGEESLTDA